MYKNLFAFTFLTILMNVSAAHSRDYISIAGSSTVLPFATIIAENLGKDPTVKTPVVESGGSSVGKKGVCEGIGTKYIDIGNASSRMKTKELAFCDKNKVKLTEIKAAIDLKIGKTNPACLLTFNFERLFKSLFFNFLITFIEGISSTSDNIIRSLSSALFLSLIHI